MARPAADIVLDSSLALRMTGRLGAVFAVLLGWALAPVLAQAPKRAPEITAAPAVNWVLPIFTDKEGFRSMTLRGSEVRPVGTKFAVTDLSITVFTGEASARVESILLSPSALFSPKDNVASGDQTVRFIRDDLEVTGVGWAYDHKAKKVSLQQNVRVTFRAELKAILQ